MSNLRTDGQSPELVERSIRTLLDENRLCSIATIAADGSPYINTCFFAYSYPEYLYILTPPGTQHSRNVETNSSVAVAIFDSKQVSGAELRGLQIFGRCQLAKTCDEQSTAFAKYVEKFPNILTYAPDVDTMLKVFESRLYVVWVEALKVFDEPTFGKEVWVSARIET